MRGIDRYKSQMWRGSVHREIRWSYIRVSLLGIKQAEGRAGLLETNWFREALVFTVCAQAFSFYQKKFCSYSRNQKCANIQDFFFLEQKWQLKEKNNLRTTR